MQDFNQNCRGRNLRKYCSDEGIDYKWLSEYKKQYSSTKGKVEKEEEPSLIPLQVICPVCKSSLCVSNNGDIYPCEGWQNLKLGNIEKQSLKEIWDENPIVLGLRNLQYKDFPKCNSCLQKQYCSICLIMNVNEDKKGNYSNVNPFICEVAKIKERSYRKGI